MNWKPSPKQLELFNSGKQWILYMGDRPMFDNQGEGASMPMETLRAKAVTMRDKLSAAVAHAEQQLVQAKRAKEIFDKNPDLEELINIMNNSGIFRY